MRLNSNSSSLLTSRLIHACFLNYVAPTLVGICAGSVITGICQPLAQRDVFQPIADFLAVPAAFWIVIAVLVAHVYARSRRKEIPASYIEPLNLLRELRDKGEITEVEFKQRVRVLLQQLQQNMMLDRKLVKQIRLLETRSDRDE
jgi:uncharacterized membrane protein